MSTTRLASIQPILAVEKHPNADLLDIVTCLGYKAIVKRDAWKVGDLCVLIEPDSVLPDAPWSAFYRAKANRVKAVRLRNVWSFSIVEALSILGEAPLMDVNRWALLPGVDVTEHLGITKYDPPTPQDLSASGPYGFGIPKTDEYRIESMNPSDIPAWGTLVDVTTKIDGQSFSALWCVRDGIEHRAIGGRSFLYKPDCDNNYTRNEKQYDVLNKLEAYCLQHNVSLCIRGESYGHGIQKASHNLMRLFLSISPSTPLG